MTARRTGLQGACSGPGAFPCGILAAGLLALVPLLSGCGYMVGNAFPREIQTIDVPVFANDTFRRGIEFQLTEAVQRKIQQRTPFRLAQGADAQTRLVGRIVNFRKDVLGENEYDDPRQLQGNLQIRISWEDLRTGQVLNEQQLPLPKESLPLSAAGEFAPEMGQSQATATNDMFDRLADRIVNMLEVPW